VLLLQPTYISVLLYKGQYTCLCGIFNLHSDVTCRNLRVDILKPNSWLGQCVYCRSVGGQQMKAIAETGCKVVVTGGKVGEMYLHYANKYRLMVVRLLSKFDLRRLCKSIGATPLPRLVSILPALLFVCNWRCWHSSQRELPVLVCLQMWLNDPTTSDPSIR